MKHPYQWHPAAVWRIELGGKMPPLHLTAHGAGSASDSSSIFTRHCSAAAMRSTVSRVTFGSALFHRRDRFLE